MSAKNPTSSLESDDTTHNLYAGDSNVLISATGANDPRDPLGPFNVILALCINV